jgi:hypothetical protein
VPLAAKAFSSEVDAGSREENALKKDQGFGPLPYASAVMPAA